MSRIVDVGTVETNQTETQSLRVCMAIMIIMQVVCSTPGPVAVVAETPAASDSAAQACKNTVFKDVLTLMDVPSMKHGYGEGGQSVQDPNVGEVLYSDRVAWRRKLTFLFFPSTVAGGHWS